MTISELNACERVSFVAALGWVFEGSAWVAERAWKHRPFAGLDELHAAMTTEVAEATLEEQLALLRAHPDLGTPAPMSKASTGEQAGAGLDRLEADEIARLQRLNAAYRRKFGYPFLFAVKNCSKHQILGALEQRLPRDSEAELAEALRQVYGIARFRLQDMVG